MDLRLGRPVFFGGAVFLFFLLPLAALFPEDNPAADPASFVGLELGELVRRLGPPRSVYAARGEEAWQDDVVFVYGDADFYLLKDRVWQIGVRSAYRISCGDPRSAVTLSFGDSSYSGAAYAAFPLEGQNWPMAVRFNFDSAGKVSGIFIFRSDI